MNKKVYLITKGRYSSYHVVAVFSSAETRQAFYDEHLSDRDEGYYGYHLEEYVLDPRSYSQLYRITEPLGYATAYAVRMQRNGDSKISELEKVPQNTEFNPSWEIEPSGQLYVECVAVDREGAIKIANEIRGSLIAEDRWEKDEGDC